MWQPRLVSLLGALALVVASASCGGDAETTTSPPPQADVSASTTAAPPTTTTITTTAPTTPSAPTTTTTEPAGDEEHPVRAEAGTLVVGQRTITLDRWDCLSLLGSDQPGLLGLGTDEPGIQHVVWVDGLIAKVHAIPDDDGFSVKSRFAPTWTGDGYEGTCAAPRSWRRSRSTP